MHKWNIYNRLNTCTETHCICYGASCHLTWMNYDHSDTFVCDVGEREINASTCTHEDTPICAQACKNMLAYACIHTHTHTHMQTHRPRAVPKWSAEQKCWPRIVFVRAALAKSLTGYELEAERDMREHETREKGLLHIQLLNSNYPLNSSFIWLKWLQKTFRNENKPFKNFREIQTHFWQTAVD